MGRGILANTRTQENLWPFTEREIVSPAKLKSGWSIGRANEEAVKAGYSGRINFRDWLKAHKLDDRSSGQIRQLGRSYDDGVAKEHADSVAKRERVGAGRGGGSSRVVGGGSGGSGSKIESEVANA